MEDIMLTIQNLSYTHPDSALLFSDISLTLNPLEKIALIGNNGTGKSILLKIIAGILMPSNGTIQLDARPYYVPQQFGQYNKLSIGEALGIDKKLKALHEILAGNISEQNYETLNDDWAIEERCNNALNYWKLSNLDLDEKLGNLSGGQTTKVFLAGIGIHQPSLVLLDEPSNHLDSEGRELLYDFIRNARQAQIIVSHDRKLLNLLHRTCELKKNEITVYGGNYDFYVSQKQTETEALTQDIRNKEKALKKAKEKEQQTIERKQKSTVRVKKKAVKLGLPKIAINTLKNSAERSTARIAEVHAGKIGNVRSELQSLRAGLSAADQMKFNFESSGLHKGKKLLIADQINYGYEQQEYLWKENINLQIVSGERIAIQGPNGSGKTTLIKLILGTLEPKTGQLFRTTGNSVYIDQNYALINADLKVYEQAQLFNTAALHEHQIKTNLNRYLFAKDDWDKSCAVLSGGERMRLMLCCLSLSNQTPDMIVLDEPTNNLDIQNIEILTGVIKDYQGTLLVVSHDTVFLEQINIGRIFRL